MSNIIKVEHLTKKYGNLTAVDDISFDVKKGDFFAFLGPNGAGKTTTISILCTILSKTDGNIEISGNELGKDDDAIRSRIGVVFQGSYLDDLLTVYENVKARASFYGMSDEDFNKRIEYLSETIGIKDFLNRRYGKLSGGQKRRADIARALINEPKILFLDEPTTGLDPQTRQKVWEVIEQVQKRHNTTIFLTTHYMEEAANADMIAVINNGKIVAHDTPMKLKEKYTTNILKMLPHDKNKLIKYLSDKKYEFKTIADTIEINLKDSLDALNILDDNKNNISSFEVLAGNMDQVFINLIGKDIKE